VSNLWHKYKEDQRKALQTSPAEVCLSASVLRAIKKITEIKPAKRASQLPVEDDTVRNAIQDASISNPRAESNE
tara:strand:+ start:753 stop:974 length:222 start_codon:yes stop_codon:yes gene_type:complete